MTPLQMYAIQLHEFYEALMEAGFSRPQATFLTAQRMRVDV